MTKGFDPHSKTYLEYFKIERNNFRQKVRYYEGLQHSLNELNWIDKTEVEIDYILALFEIGKYHKYLDLVDKYLFIVIRDNIYTILGKNIYEELLFRKAASLFNLSRFKEALYIQRQVARIVPEEKLYMRFLEKCIRMAYPEKYMKFRNLALLLILSLVMVLTFETLVVQPFLPKYLEIFPWCKYLLLATACMLFVYSEYLIKRDSRACIEQ